jgi:hypothetical protein
MIKIKIFECLLCKNLFFNNVKGEKRYYGTRKDVREHLAKYHHINRRAGTPSHKGNRTRGTQDERSKITQNCILYKEY